MPLYKLLIIILMLASSKVLACGESLCGCARDATVIFGTVVINFAGESLDYIDVYCDAGDPVAQTNEFGEVSFKTNTFISPGCGMERCSVLRFVDPKDRYEDLKISYEKSLGKVVTLHEKK